MRTIITLFIFSIFITSGYAQREMQQPGVMDATIHKTFTIKQDGTSTEYNLKVLEHRKYPITMDAADKNKINQARETMPANVTKLIGVDSDNDQDYEHYMVLKYKRSVADSFKVVPTARGFAVKVDDKTFEYFVDEGIYFIDNQDQDFFIVEEFKEMS